MAVLKIFCIDLIAYVPENNGTQLRALMPVTPPEDGHTPYFIFSPDNFVSGDSGIWGSFLNAWQLGGEELSIPHTGTGNLNFSDPVPQNKALPDDWDTRFHWTTKLTGCHSQPGKGHVNPMALGANAHGLVIARMRMDHGTIRTFHFSTDEGTYLIHTYDFFHADTVERQKKALVNITVWEKEFEGNEVIIKSQHFSGQHKRELILKPINGEVHAVFANLGRLEKHQSSNPSEHFKYYYNLVSDWELEPRRIPKRFQAGPSRPDGNVHQRFPRILNIIRDYGAGDVFVDLEGCPQTVLEP